MVEQEGPSYMAQRKPRSKASGAGACALAACVTRVVVSRLLCTRHAFSKQVGTHTRIPFVLCVHRLFRACFCTRTSRVILLAACSLGSS